MEKINFKDLKHKEFYIMNVLDVKPELDVYNKSLIYLLGLSEDTRNHFNNIYDVEKREINIEELNAPWQTSGSLAITRLAFNLFNGFAGLDIEDTENNEESRITDKKKFAVDNIFCYREYAPYFYEAIKIRFEMNIQ